MCATQSLMTDPISDPSPERARTPHIDCVILGCGSSGGVPRINGDWGVCDPAEPKNRRSRCSTLFRQYTTPECVTRLLVDTAPDLRNQLLAAETSDLDAVAFTHDHADQTHGIDDLRPLIYTRGARLPSWADAPTMRTLKARFGYCFKTPPGSSYPPLLDEMMIENRQDGMFSVSGAGGDMQVSNFRQFHGDIESLGFRVGNIAYSSDLNGLPEESFAALQGLSCWVIDALRHQPHPTHLHLDSALALIEKVRPRRAVLTNLHVDMDYRRLRAYLPDHIVPAYDGMVITDDHEPHP